MQAGSIPSFAQHAKIIENCRIYDRHTCRDGYYDTIEPNGFATSDHLSRSPYICGMVKFL